MNNGRGHQTDIHLIFYNDQNRQIYRKCSLPGKTFHITKYIYVVVVVIVVVVVVVVIVVFVVVVVLYVTLQK